MGASIQFPRLSPGPRRNHNRTTRHRQAHSMEVPTSRVFCLQVLGCRGVSSIMRICGEEEQLHAIFLSISGA